MCVCVCVCVRVCACVCVCWAQTDVEGELRNTQQKCTMPCAANTQTHIHLLLDVVRSLRQTVAIKVAVTTQCSITRAQGSTTTGCDGHKCP